jgi:hypothetical protein
MEAAGTFPRRRKISSWSVAWDVEEVSEWISRRPTATVHCVDKPATGGGAKTHGRAQ